MQRQVVCTVIWSYLITAQYRFLSTIILLKICFNCDSVPLNLPMASHYVQDRQHMFILVLKRLHNLDLVHQVFTSTTSVLPVVCVCVCVCMLVAQSCPSLCNSKDCSLPGSSIHAILWARILEWVAIPFSSGSSHPGIEPRSHALQVDSLLSEPPGKPIVCHSHSQNMVLGPAAAASRNPLEMKLHRHHPRPINSGVGKRTTDI